MWWTTILTFLDKFLLSKDAIRTAAIVISTTIVVTQINKTSNSIKAFSDNLVVEAKLDSVFRSDMTTFKTEMSYSSILTVHYIADLSKTLESVTNNNALIVQELSKKSPNIQYIERIGLENNKLLTENLPHYKLEKDSILNRTYIIGIKPWIR
jgi:glycyl-tRNA synthetase (class II)